MIRKYNETEKTKLTELIEKDRFQNVYFYIDACTNGFEGDNIETYIVGDNGGIGAVIYIYHNSIQLFSVLPVTDAEAKEIADFIMENKIRRISGNKEIIGAVCAHIVADYTKTDGYIMVCEENEAPDSEVVSFADEKDFEEIAELIYADPHLGAGYEYHDLLKQLKKRFLNEGCESVIIRTDGRLVSHFASYAVAEDVAVLSGMVTHPAHRGKGHGGILVRTLSAHILKNGRTPILYCYENEYYNWYKKLGYKTIGTSAKIDLCY